MARINAILLIATCCITLASDAARAPAAWALEVSVRNAEIVWYGVYHADQTKIEKDPGSLGGLHSISADVTPPSTNRDWIAIADDIRFGFGYRLAGEPIGAKVKLKVVQRIPAPGIFNKVTGKHDLVGEFEVTKAIGGTGYNGFRIDKGATIPAGTWTFELWYEDRKLVAKSFTLYR